MKIIIIGCGRVGEMLAGKLNNVGHDVTIIDLSATKVNEISSRYDIMGVIGNGATQSIQHEAGVETADLLIAVTNSDELNLLCCIVAQREGKCQTIARVKNPEYRKEIPYLKEQLGLAMVINPEYAAAEEIARVLRFPAAIKIEPFAKGKVELIKFRLLKDCSVIGLTVREMMTRYHSDILVGTVERGDEAYIPRGDFKFEERDIVSIIATPANANEFFKKITYKGHSIKKALVAGGGEITQYLCGILEQTKIDLKVIERDKKVCEELCARSPKVDVIHGKATNRELLLEEGINKAGAFVALSDLDEENVLLSLFAKELGKGKLVTKINRTDYDDVINRLDFDTVICPINITSDIIVRYVRAMDNAKGSNVETLYNVIPNKVEAAEFIIKEKSPVANKMLMDLKFRKDVLVAAILRGNDVITPRGQDVIQAGDAVVVVSKRLGMQDITDVLK